MQKKIISKTKFLKLNAESAKKMGMNKANQIIFK